MNNATNGENTLNLAMTTNNYYVGFTVYNSTRSDANYYHYITSRTTTKIKIEDINAAFDSNAKFSVFIIGY